MLAADARLAARRADASGSSEPITSLDEFARPDPPPPSAAAFILFFHALALAYPPVSPLAYLLNAGELPMPTFAPVARRRCWARLLSPSAGASASMASSFSVELTPIPARLACAGLPPTSDSLMTSRNGDGSAYTVRPNLIRLNARHRKSLRLARVRPT